MFKSNLLIKKLAVVSLACLLTTQSVFATTISDNSIDDSTDSTSDSSLNNSYNTSSVTSDSRDYYNSIDYLKEYEKYYKFDYDKNTDYVNEDLTDADFASANKKVLIIGDSLTVGYKSAYHPEWGFFQPFTFYLDQKPGITVVRKAYGGATLSTSSGWENPFSLIRETDLSYFDIIIIFLGSNDWDVSTRLGDSESRDTSEFNGSLNAILDTCLTSGAKVYGVTPLPRIEKFDGRTNWVGLTTTDYADAFRSRCLSRGVPIIDCQTEFNIDGTNYMDNYIDFVHPKPVLAQRMADYFYYYLNGGSANQAEIRGFTERLYRICLSREPDAAGLNNWCNLLATQKKTGSEVAEGFFFSQEFKNHNYTDKEFLTLLYKTMMNREPDESGMKYWLEILSSGVSRKYVYRGFVESTEFINICNNYGIVRGGVLLDEPRDYTQKGTALISRMYTKALGRSYDVQGLNYWTSYLWSGKKNIDKVSTDGFFHSPEFTSKNLSDLDYTKVLYRTYLNREYDEQGLNYWVNNLKNGYTRDTVMYGFSNSEEFEKTKDVYNLRNGY